MSITQAQQAEKGYKKAALNVAMTGQGGLPFFTEPASPTIAYGQNIAVDIATIPTDAPTTSLTNGTRFNAAGEVTTGDDAIIQYNEAVMSSYPGSSNNSYILSTFTGIIIPFNFGNGSYGSSFFANSLTGASIPFGLNAWEFDTAAGVLTFFDGKPSSVSANAVGIKFWTYVGRTAADLGDSSSGANVTTQNYVLSSTTPPANAVYNSTTEQWTITHNLNSTNLIAKLVVNGQVTVPDTVETDTNTLTLKVLSNLDKTNGTKVYPSNVSLTIYKLA